ncbi:MAG: HEAT repeat domain-containing protein [Tenacibaculum sp.]|nr:HEAT repeat domain-containing protein [Tenacibaculum sp.]
MEKNLIVIDNFFERINYDYSNQNIVSALNEFAKSYDLLTHIEMIVLKLSSVTDLDSTELRPNKIILKEENGYELSIFYSLPNHTEDAQRVLYSHPSDLFLCPIFNMKDSKINVFYQKNNLEENKLDLEAKLIHKCSREVLANSTLHIEKFKSLYEFDKTKFFIAYSLSKTNSLSSYSWEYNLDTLKPTRLVISDLRLGRIMTSIKILGMSNSKESIKNLISLTNHKEHIIRWEAVRAIINIDFLKGKEILQNMLVDPHPEICNAAKKSLIQIN